MTINVYETADNKTQFYHTLFKEAHALSISKLGAVPLKSTVQSLGNGTSSVLTAGPSNIFLIPGWVTIFPPIVTVVCAIATKMTLVSLLLGIFCGAFFVCAYNPMNAFLRSFDTYFLDSFCSSDHSAIMMFTFLLGGLLGMVQKSGGSRGLANSVQRLAGRSRHSILGVAFGLSVLILFDDYSCILIVGSAIKPIISDPTLGISAEKLAFIVHNIGVCLASMAPVSSWLGAELSYIQQQYEALEIETNAFQVYVSGLPWRTFPILLVLYTGVIVFVRRDFGPLFTADTKAIERTGESPYRDLDTPLLTSDDDAVPAPAIDPLDPPPDAKPQWFNAVIPFTLIVVLTFLGMYFNGVDSLNLQGLPVTFTAAIAASDSIKALIWSTSFSTFLLLLMVAVQWKWLHISLGTMMEAWVLGVKEMLEPMLILILAWGLGDVIADLQTAKFLAGVLRGGFPATLLAPLSLLMSMVISFASGSAMGTMGILFPLAIPIAFELEPDNEQLLVQISAMIFAGCAFGNCCSPIADTTILSCMATGCKVTDHLKSTVPHCLVVACVSFLASFWTSLGLSWAFALTMVVLVFVLVSKNPSQPHSRSLADKMCSCVRSPSSKQRQSPDESTEEGD